MAKNNEKKTVGIIVAVAVVILIAVAIFSVSIVKAIVKENTSNTTQYTLQSSQSTTENSNTIIDNSLATDVLVIPSTDALPTEAQTGSSTGSTTTSKVTEKATNEATNEATTEYDPIAAYEDLEKQGDAYASDDPDNKHIKKIADKYNVDPGLLVVLYSEPKSGENIGTNYILEFDGTKDSSGKYVRSPDTLKKVYHIDADGKISITQGKMTGNVGVSYADGMLVFNMVKVILMPKYPDYFTGV